MTSINNFSFDVFMKNIGKKFDKYHTLYNDNYKKYKFMDLDKLYLCYNNIKSIKDENLKNEHLNVLNYFLFEFLDLISSIDFKSDEFKNKLFIVRNSHRILLSFFNNKKNTISWFENYKNSNNPFWLPLMDYNSTIIKENIKSHSWFYIRELCNDDKQKLIFPTENFEINKSVDIKPNLNDKNNESIDSDVKKLNITSIKPFKEINDLSLKNIDIEKKIKPKIRSLLLLDIDNKYKPINFPQINNLTNLVNLIEESKKEINAPIKKSILPKNKSKKDKIDANGIIKVKLYPTEKQKKVLKSFFYGYNWAWNKLVDASAKYGGVFNITDESIFSKLRDIVKKKNIDKSLNVFKCPEECLDSAYRDFIKAILSVKSKIDKKNEMCKKKINYPKNLKFKKKKDNTGSIELRKKKLKYKSSKKCVSFWPTFFKQKSNKTNEKNIKSGKKEPVLETTNCMKNNKKKLNTEEKKIKVKSIKKPTNIKKETPQLKDIDLNQNNEINIETNKKPKTKAKKKEKNIETTKENKYAKNVVFLNKCKKYIFLNEDEIRIKTNLKKIKLVLHYSLRLIMKKDEFFLYIPYNRICPEYNNKKDILSIDPGVRTFLTGYNHEGSCIDIAYNQKLLKIKNKRINLLKSKLSKSTHKKKKKRYKKEIKFLYKKIQNCVNDMHHKVSKFLSQNYQKILLPKFETQKMVANKILNRKINKETSNNLNMLSHYKFKQLLNHKMKLRKGELIECTEEYTTKTCGNCGILNHSIGSKKIFICPSCNIRIDRDINAARNILIKNRNMVF